MKESIEAWLDAEVKNHNEGVQLLSKVCKNRNIINYVMRETPDRLKKLEYELCKAIGRNYEPVQPTAPSVPEPVQETVGPDPLVESLLEDEAKEQEALSGESLGDGAKELILVRRATYAQRNELSDWLAANTKEGEELSEEAKEKMETLGKLDEKIQDLSAQLRLLASKGIFWKATKPAAPSNLAELQAKLEGLEKTERNLRANVTKANKSAKERPDNPEIAENAAKLKAELDAIRAEIKNLKAELKG
jgi:hypothetical protein